jgi:hypothetical protein
MTSTAFKLSIFSAFLAAGPALAQTGVAPRSPAAGEPLQVGSYEADTPILMGSMIKLLGNADSAVGGAATPVVDLQESGRNEGQARTQLAPFIPANPGESGATPR